jgi:hypothetical protein
MREVIVYTAREAQNLELGIEVLKSEVIRLRTQLSQIINPSNEQDSQAILLHLQIQELEQRLLDAKMSGDMHCFAQFLKTKVETSRDFVEAHEQLASSLNVFKGYLYHDHAEGNIHPIFWLEEPEKFTRVLGDEETPNAYLLHNLLVMFDHALNSPSVSNEIISLRMIFQEIGIAYSKLLSLQIKIHSFIENYAEAQAFFVELINQQFCENKPYSELNHLEEKRKITDLVIPIGIYCSHLNVRIFPKSAP